MSDQALPGAGGCMPSVSCPLFSFFFSWAGGGKSHGQSGVLCWAEIVGQAGPIWAAAGGQLLSHEGNCSSLGLNGVGTSQDQPLCAGCLEHVTLGTALCLWTSYLTSLSPFSTSMNVGWDVERFQKIIV